jgi:ribose transport system substrate-binding protein
VIAIPPLPKMNKHSSFSSIVTSLAVGLVCVTSAFAQTKRVAVIVMNTSSVFFQAIIKGAQDAASQANGVTVIPMGSTQEGDLAGAIRALEDAVSQKPVAVIVTPADPDAFGPPIDSIPKGIVVVTADSKAHSDRVDIALSTNNVEGGKLAARALAEAIKKKYGKAEGEVAILSNAPSVSTLFQRQDGFKEVLAKDYPGLKVVTLRIGDGNAPSGITNCLDVLSAFPNLRGIWADGGPQGMGAGQALGESNGQERVMMVSFDVNAKLLDLLKTGVIKALVLQDPYKMGFEGVKDALAKADGKEVPKDIDTGATVVTADNLNTPEIQALLKNQL